MLTRRGSFHIKNQKGLKVMTQKKKLSSRFLSLFLAVLMIASMIPTTVFAAPASDIPSEMLDNVYLDALAYTGYGVQAQPSSTPMVPELRLTARTFRMASLSTVLKP